MRFIAYENCKRFFKSYKEMNFKRINLLMITSNGVGGGPKQISSLCNSISNEINIFVACPRINTLKIYKKNFSNANFVYIKERKISLKDIYNLCIFIRKNSINIIHSHGKGASLIGRILAFIFNIKHIYTFHGIHLVFHNFLYKKLFTLYENLFGFIDSHKIFVSDSEKLCALKKGFIIKKNHSVILNGINVNNKLIDQKKIKRKIRSKLNIKIDEIIVITVCRLVNQKNIFELLEIAKICKTIKFLILGNGDLKNQIMEKIKRENIENVFLLGNKKDIKNYLISSDIFISTSIYEGLPFSVLEAMSYKLPVVLSKVTGNIDTIENNISGYFYNLGKIIQASNIIKHLSVSKKERNLIGVNAYLRIKKKFNLKNMTSMHEKLYFNLVKKNNL